jgi:hypothetical protein
VTSGYTVVTLDSCCCSTATARSTFDESGCLGCDSVSLGEWWLPVFQRNIVPPFSRTKRQFFWDLLTFEGEDTTFLRNVQNCSPNDTSSHARRPESSAAQL